MLGASLKRFLKAVPAAAVLMASSASVLSATVSYTGTLADENDVAFFSFTLAGPSDVTLRTWSYAGGTSAAGTVIVAGGFDPIVSLFFGTGGGALLIGANDDGLGVAVDPATGFAFDSLLESFALPVGTYTVALTQFANFANGPTLGDGFLGAGIPGFDGRTNAWALDISVGAPAGVPEPTALMLAVLGLAAVGAARRRWPVASSSA